MMMFIGNQLVFIVLLFVGGVQQAARSATKTPNESDGSRRIQNKLYKCLEHGCPYATNVYYDLTVHKRIHTGERPYKCRVCETWFKRCDQRASHERTHTEDRPYACKICEKTFKRKYHLDVHELSHRGALLYKCHFVGCEMAYATREYLKDHQQTHTGIALHVCLQCGKKLANAASLSRHIKMVHNTEEFSCPQCPAAFSSYANLRAHMKAHTLKHAFKCYACCLSYRCQSHMTRHNEKYHAGVAVIDETDDLIEAPIPVVVAPVCSCDICSQDCGTLAALRAHKKTHRASAGVVCGQCSTAFSTEKELEEHKLVHTGVKNFPCEFPGCGEAFVQAVTLEAHHATHTNKKLHACSECSSSFYFQRQLRQHKQTCHSVSINFDALRDDLLTGPGLTIFDEEA